MPTAQHRTGDELLERIRSVISTQLRAAGVPSARLASVLEDALLSIRGEFGGRCLYFSKGRRLQAELRRDKAVELKRQGATAEQIAGQLGITPRRVLSLLGSTSVKPAGRVCVGRPGYASTKNGARRKDKT